MAALGGPATVGGAKRPFGESSGAAGGPLGGRPGLSSVDDSDSTSERDLQTPARQPDLRRNWAAGDGRVVQLRKEEYRALERKNNETFTLIDRGPGVEPLNIHLFVHKDALCIFPADQARGTEAFKTSPAVQETLAQLKHISINYDRLWSVSSGRSGQFSMVRSSHS
jgi:hypothetical protein